MRMLRTRNIDEAFQSVYYSFLKYCLYCLELSLIICLILKNNYYVLLLFVLS
jgi:hypothetical protein